MSVPEPVELLALAREVAREAGDLARRLHGEGVEVARTKSSPVDVVTEADQEVEALIRERLHAARPDDALVGEEGEDDPGSSGLRWIVDPIDGTVNFLYGLPHWAVSIAVADQAEVLAGVVHSPGLDAEYAAARGAGAWGNDVRLHCGEPTDLRTALVATGFGYDARLRAHQGEAVARMLPQVRDARRLGSCALDICAVAAQAADAYVEEGAHIWDHAAASLVAREAGARFELWPTDRGNDLIVCAPPTLWPAFAVLVEECGFAGPALA